MINDAVMFTEHCNCAIFNINTDVLKTKNSLISFVE